jgi:hypothetical protein
MRPSRFISAWILVASSCVFAGAQASTNTKDSYQALLERVKAGDKTVDFGKLRLAYSETASGSDTRAQKEAMTKALRANNFAEAIKAADTVLAAEYVNMDAHLTESIAYRELKEAEQAEFHKSVYDHLIKSILDSGDGKAPETAYVVISVDEEYVVLKAIGILRLPISQGLMHKGGHSYDVLVIQDPTTNQRTTLYFNVDIPIKHGE